MSSKKSKETKTTLTNEQRKDIIKHKEKNPQISQADLDSWVKQTMGLTVHQTTISHLIKNKEEIRKNPIAKRQRTVQHPILQSQERIILSNEIIVKKAKSFAKSLNIPEDNHKFSHSWLYKFKQRHRLKRITKHGEDASVDEKVIRTAIPDLRETLKDYNLKDIYNMDETGFLEPDTMLATYESKKDNKLDILTTIKFIVRGWREVSSKTRKNCFQHTGILPLVQDNDEEPTTNDNDDDIMEEFDEEDDSVDMPQITYKEALDAIYQIKLYLIQQDLNYVVQTEHDVALSKLYELVKKLQNASFKQLNIETFFEPV
ncbi:21278_t:CDS:2, partial [Racocetra persica]